MIDEDKLMALFDKYNLFTERSYDSGKTWIKYTLEERIELAVFCCVCLDSTEEEMQSEIIKEKVQELFNKYYDKR